MERGPWIIGGSIVLAAAIVAMALLVVLKDDPAEPERPGVASAILEGAEQRAQDRSAQSSLRNAIAAADVFFTDGDTYAGWGPEVAGQIEPYLAWSSDAPTAVDVVSINLANAEQVVMSTLSASGQPFCIAKNVAPGGGQYLGTVDAVGATSATACAGGW
jgi:type IV pilus assembly protein PilA